MKGVVAFDTYYGNTKRVAESIAEEIRAEGHEAELRNVRERYETVPRGDFAFVGSPIRIAKTSRRIRRFVKKLDPEAWRGKPIVVFDTIMPPKEPVKEEEKARAEKWVYGPGKQLRDLARARGLTVHEEVLHVPVKDLKGPLVDDADKIARDFTRGFLQTLKK